MFNSIIYHWDNLFFEKINYPFIGVSRILIGVICLCKIFLLLKNRYEYFGEKGFFPYKAWKNNVRKKDHFSIFHYLKPNNFSVDVVLFFSIVSSFFFMIGFCTEIACITNFCLFISIGNRNGHIFNAGDTLLRILLFLLVFSNCGHYISIDNIIYNRPQINALVSPYAIRLIQIVIIKVYINAFYSKLLFSDFWRKGTGLYYSMSSLWVCRYNLNSYLNKFVFVFLNYATLIAESMLVLGLIFKETSKICVFILMIMHLLFEILLRINLFGIIMIACLFLFLRNDVFFYIISLI